MRIGVQFIDCGNTPPRLFIVVPPHGRNSILASVSRSVDPPVTVELLRGAYNVVPVPRQQCPGLVEISGASLLASGDRPRPSTAAGHRLLRRIVIEPG
jgi:hypothetical protein